MVEDAGDVEVVEEVGVLGHGVGVVLGDVLEHLDELAPAHHFYFALDRTDHVFEFVVHEQSTVTVLGVLDHIVSHRGSFVVMLVPVGKFKGSSMLVIAVSRMSAIGLHRATDPLSPITNSL